MQPTSNKNTIHFTLLKVLISQSKLAQLRQIPIGTLKLIKLPSFLFTPFICLLPQRQASIVSLFVVRTRPDVAPNSLVSYKGSQLWLTVLSLSTYTQYSAT